MAEPRVPIKMTSVGGHRPTGRAPCGTYAGVAAHNARGERVCPDCLAARAAYTAMRRFRSGMLHDLRRCRECGSVFADHSCHAGRP